MAIGTPTGVRIGAALDNVVLGIGTGLAIGIAMGSVWRTEIGIATV